MKYIISDYASPYQTYRYTNVNLFEGEFQLIAGDQIQVLKTFWDQTSTYSLTSFVFISTDFQLCLLLQRRLSHVTTFA